jgi:hypothetical protein
MSWQLLEQSDPELAEMGYQRLTNKSIAYLATVRADGSPRVHPITAIIGKGRMFVFMDAKSPKGRDLLRDNRYSLHNAVDDQIGNGGEFLVDGRATLVEDAETRQLAISFADFTVLDSYILFELSVERVLATTYRKGQPPLRQRWQAPSKSA